MPSAHPGDAVRSTSAKMASTRVASESAMRTEGLLATRCARAAGTITAMTAGQSPKRIAELHTLIDEPQACHWRPHSAITPRRGRWSTDGAGRPPPGALAHKAGGRVESPNPGRPGPERWHDV